VTHIEDHFGESGPWTVGVEEELMLVDGQTYALVPRAHEVIAAAGLVPGEFKQELFASILETATGICANADDALRDLRALRSAACARAEELGLHIAAAGSHPESNPVREEIADAERYREMVDMLGVTARRQGVNGLHVHVGMPDAESCHRALEAVLPWLPLVLALSANSPFIAGEETGHASNRAEILAQLPRSGAPPPCASYADWEAVVAHFQRLGIVKDYTQFWWDARPHPRLGTLEIRMPDQPTSVERSAAVAALLQALCVTVLEDGGLDGHAPRAIYEQNRWAALRHGLRAELVHPVEDRMETAENLAAELVERVRPAARALRSEHFLDEFADYRSEGELQSEIASRAGLQRLLADLVRRSLASPA
jgi:carboxylate-amine ligase